MKSNRVAKRNRRRLLQAAGAITAPLLLNGLPFALRAASAAHHKKKIGIIGSGCRASSKPASMVRAARRAKPLPSAKS